VGSRYEVEISKETRWDILKRKVPNPARKIPFALLIAICAMPGCRKGGFTAAERAAAATLKPVKDPVAEEIYSLRGAIRQDYDNRRFQNLEKRAVELRRSKPLFGKGSWKLVQFYESFTCRSEEPENMSQLHDQIHRDWINAFPQSLTARVGYADFFQFICMARAGSCLCRQSYS
jgi:hypothetical protein